jgi:hypothetical protein
MSSPIGGGVAGVTNSLVGPWAWQDVTPLMMPTPPPLPAALRTPCPLTPDSGFNLPPLLDAPMKKHVAVVSKVPFTGPTHDDILATSSATTASTLLLGLVDDDAAMMQRLCTETKADNVGPVSADALQTPQPLCSATATAGADGTRSLLALKWEEVLSTSDFSSHLGGALGTDGGAAQARGIMGFAPEGTSSGFPLLTPTMDDLDHALFLTEDEDLFFPEFDNHYEGAPLCAPTPLPENVPAPTSLLEEDAFTLPQTAPTTTTTVAQPQADKPVRRTAKRGSAPATAAASDAAKKKKQVRRKKEAVPDERKDDAYWEYRRKNNERAKRSRQKKKEETEREQARLQKLASEGGRLRNELDQLHDAYASLSAAVATRVTHEFGSGAAAEAALPDAIRAQLEKVQAALSRAEALRDERASRQQEEAQ